jgi:hypothetical protein
LTDEYEIVGGTKIGKENPPLHKFVHHKCHMTRLMSYLNTGRFYGGKYLHTMNYKIGHTRFLQKGDVIISRKSLMKRNLPNDAFFNTRSILNQCDLRQSIKHSKPKIFSNIQCRTMARQVNNLQMEI